MPKRKTKNSKRKSKTKLKNDTDFSLPRLEEPGSNRLNHLKVKSEKTSKPVKTVLPELETNRRKRRKRNVSELQNYHENKRGKDVFLPKVVQKEKKKFRSFSERYVNGKIHNSSKISLTKPKVKEVKKPNEMSSKTKQNCIKESLNLKGFHKETNYSPLTETYSSELENQESELNKMGKGFLPDVGGAELVHKVTQAKYQTLSHDDDKFTGERRKVFQHLKSSDKVEISDSGIEQSNGSGSSESTKYLNDDPYEHDVIFEEVMESGSIKPHPKKRRELRPRILKSNTRNLPKLKNVESGPKLHRDRGNLLLTTEFKVKGLEISLKDNTTRMANTTNKKPNNFTCAVRPKISTQKQIKDGYGIYGSKVMGCAVDVDECVIAMVRLYNCNDSVKQDVGLQEFSSRLCQGFFCLADDNK